MNLTTLALIIGILNTLAIGIIALLRFMAPKTETKLDDQIVAGIDMLTESEWIEKMFPLFWSAVEATSKLPDANPAFKGIRKLDEFLLQLRDAYRLATGKELTASGQALASKLAGAASTAAKLDPRPAPASK